MCSNQHTSNEEFVYCAICGKECGKRGKITGNPKVSHLECVMKATEEIRKETSTGKNK